MLCPDHPINLFLLWIFSYQGSLPGSELVGKMVPILCQLQLPVCNCFTIAMKHIFLANFCHIASENIVRSFLVLARRHDHERNAHSTNFSLWSYVAMYSYIRMMLQSTINSNLNAIDDLMMIRSVLMLFCHLIDNYRWCSCYFWVVSLTSVVSLTKN